MRWTHIVFIGAWLAGLLVPASWAGNRSKTPDFWRSASIYSKAAPSPQAPGTKDYLLRPDPVDRAPLGDRTPVILVHGFDSTVPHLPFNPRHSRNWDRFRADYRYPEAFAQFKFYRFDYRPWRHLREVGADLSEEVVQQILPELAEHQSIVFMGISAGALISRYGASDPRIHPRVIDIFTINGANRGSVIASLAQVNGKIWRAVGPHYALLLNHSRKGTVISPGTMSLAYDNFDGTLPRKAVRKYGITENTELRHFNETDPNLGKITAYHAVPKTLFGKGKFGLEPWLRMRIVSKLHKSFKTVDPLVHDRSGFLAGAKIRRRRIFKGYDHFDYGAPPVIKALFADLSEVPGRLRGQRFRKLHSYAE